MRVDFGLPSRDVGGSECPVVLTIGNFDGVHRGHRALIDALVADARARDGEAVVMTFEPHPRCVLDPDNCPQQLTTLDEKRELLAAAGVDRLVGLEFTRTLSRWSAEHFCEQLVASFAVARVVGGSDFALGHNRRGGGFATANLGITPGKWLPARGVYAMWAKVQGAWHMAATNVGYRPTFGGDRLTVEAFLLDFEGDIYRERVRAAFVGRLREERAYPSAEALTEQIALDVEETRGLLAAQAPPADL